MSVTVLSPEESEETTEGVIWLALEAANSEGYFCVGMCLGMPKGIVKEKS